MPLQSARASVLEPRVNAFLMPVYIADSEAEQIHIQIYWLTKCRELTSIPRGTLSAHVNAQCAEKGGHRRDVRTFMLSTRNTTACSVKPACAGGVVGPIRW